MIAEPMPGFVFDGWQGVDNQKITGFLNIVTLNYPTVIRPLFRLARRIDLRTEPVDLDLFADRGRVSTPVSLDWSYGSTHTLAIPSPQQARNGSWWIFSRWSDGSPENRSYTVEPGSEPKVFTAVFVPATAHGFPHVAARAHLEHRRARQLAAALPFPMGRGRNAPFRGSRAADRPGGPAVAVQRLVERRSAGTGI